MSIERPRKNFKTADGTPEGYNYSQNFQDNSDQPLRSFTKPKSEKSKKIKKPKNKLNLNKFHQPIFKKENEKKVLKKKARDLKRLIDKDDVAEEIKEAKQVELKEVTQKLEIKQKKQKRQDRKIKFLEQKYKSIKNVEMKKVNRALEKVTKQVSMTLDQEKKEELLAEKKKLQMQYNYIRNFPKDKKYLSLFPKEENEKMVALRTKIMKEIQSRVDQKEKYLNKIELDPKKKELEEKKGKKDEKKKVQKDSDDDSSDMDVEESSSSESESSESESMEEEVVKKSSKKEKKEVEMPKLGKKYVDNFFVAPSAKVDEKIGAKVVGKDGRVLKNQTVQKKQKTLSDSDSDSSDSDSD